MFAYHVAACSHLSPEERAANALGIRAGLQVALQRAQVAVLRRDQSDFSAALIESRAQVQQHFNADDDITRRFLEDLDYLSQTPVQAEVEGIGTALQLLNEMSDE